MTRHRLNLRPSGQRARQYTEISADRLAAQTDGLSHLDEALLLYLTKAHRPIAFVLCLPDISAFVADTRGDLHPLNQLRLLATRSWCRREAVLVVKGTIPGEQGRGYMRLLSRELHAGLRRGGYHPGRLLAEVADRLTGVRRLACRDLAGLLRAADLHQFGDPGVTRELRAWLRLTPRHPRYRLDGLTDRALELGAAQALGLRASLALHPVLRRLGLPRVLAAASGGLLDHDGDVLVLVGPVTEQVELGRTLMRHWLTLAGLGHTTHPLSQIIDCDRTREALADRLGVADPLTLLHVARVGRPKAPAERSARVRT
ncbi:MAG: hypothetical protein K0R62_1463 [Nonomuraea muscovyensis]|nr:hypothetical protein [Nonomuraea muscovyensis]